MLASTLIQILLDLTLNLDTGSSDLVVILQGRDINLTNSTNVQTGEAFGVGQAIGNVAFADLQLGDFTIQSQGTLFPSTSLR